MEGRIPLRIPLQVPAWRWQHGGSYIGETSHRCEAFNIVASMALVKSGALVKTPRRRRFWEMSRKNRSTMFSHEAEVGVKSTQRGCVASGTGR